MLDAVDARGRAGEQGALLIRACTLGEALERVPQLGIARTPTVDGVIAFEHGAVRPKGIDAGVDIGAPHGGQMFRSVAFHRPVFRKPAKGHGQTAELHRDIGAFGQRVDRVPPAVEILVQLAAIARDIERRSAMVEHDLLVGKGLRQCQYVTELRLEQPGIEGETVTGICCETSAECIGTIEALRCMEGRSEYLGIGVPGCGMPNTAKAAVTRCHKRLDHRLDRIACGQVGVTDDRSTRPVVAIEPARSLRRDAIDEFDLTHRLHRLIARGVIERAAFHEDRAHDVVTAMRIRKELIEGVIGCANDRLEEIVSGFWKGRKQWAQIPQVVVRIDDRQVGLDDRFGHVWLSPIRAIGPNSCPQLCTRPRWNTGRALIARKRTHPSAAQAPRLCAANRMRVLFGVAGVGGFARQADKWFFPLAVRAEQGITMKHFVVAAAFALTLPACSPAPPASDIAQSNVLELAVEGMTFVGPDTIKSGWTTVRVVNAGGMTHHALVYRLPEGVTAEMVDEQVVRPIQASLTAAINGEMEKAADIAASMPAWVGELTWLGGPGMMSDGVTGEATMYLEPGNYLVECYVKTKGIQHNFNPVAGEFGMVFPLTVVAEPGGMAEPDANVTLAISNDGYEITEGGFVAGSNSVRVNFKEQRLYNNFVGHDAHVFRVEEETDVDAAARWPDFFPIDGQQTPAPARFVGGIHDMPQGSTGYFRLDLEPGTYAITAEIPDAKAQGFFKQFNVKAP